MHRNLRCFSVLLLIVCFAVSSTACELPKCPQKYLVPEGYVGWARVYFDVKGAPALPKEGEFTVVKFQQLTTRTTGPLELYTSSPEFDGCDAIGTEYHYYHKDGETHLIRRDIGLRSGITTILNENQGYTSGIDAPERVYKGFFVGTTEQMESGSYKSF